MMIIAIAGPYSAETEELKAANLSKLNEAAKQVYLLGHTPIIGVNLALSIADKFPKEERYEVIMNISLTAVAKCDALLLIAESPGANKERDLMIELGKPVFYSIEEIKALNNNDCI